MIQWILTNVLHRPWHVLGPLMIVLFDHLLMTVFLLVFHRPIDQLEYLLLMTVL